MLKHNKRQLCLKDPKVETERNSSGKKLVVFSSVFTTSIENAARPHCRHRQQQQQQHNTCQCLAVIVIIVKSSVCVSLSAVFINIEPAPDKTVINGHWRSTCTGSGKRIIIIISVES